MHFSSLDGHILFFQQFPMIFHKISRRLMKYCSPSSGKFDLFEEQGNDEAHSCDLLLSEIFTH